MKCRIINSIFYLLIKVNLYNFLKKRLSNRKREYIIKKATVEGYKITAFEIARRREKNEKYFGYLSKAKELNQRAEEEKLPWALMEAH